VNETASSSSSRSRPFTSHPHPPSLCHQQKQFSVVFPIDITMTTMTKIGWGVLAGDMLVGPGRRQQSSNVSLLPIAPRRRRRRLTFSMIFSISEFVRRCIQPSSTSSSIKTMYIYMLLCNYTNLILYHARTI
jgi:hypothetical protein